MARRLLVVEDDAKLREGLERALGAQGFDVLTAADGVAGLEAARTAAPDLVVLDLGLPGLLDGWRVLRTLREDGLDTPVIVLTARNEEADKLAGFRLGADDYVTKPFGVLELVARIDAVLRRAERRPAPAPSRVEVFGDVELDAAAREVRVRGAPVELAPRAFDLLVALVRRSPRVVSRGELLKLVWGYQPGVASRTVDTHVVALRRVLERDPERPRHVLTVWKAGYKFVP